MSDEPQMHAMLIYIIMRLYFSNLLIYLTFFTLIIRSVGCQMYIALPEVVQSASSIRSTVQKHSGSHFTIKLEICGNQQKFPFKKVTF